MRITIDVRKNRLPEIAKRAAQVAADVIRETVADIETGAKARAAVDTGFMRDHINGRVINQNAGEVVSEAPYSDFVERGTRFAPAQPFMTPAAEAARPRFEAAVAKAIADLG
jgi:HK97 gp10 family phage protein